MPQSLGTVSDGEGSIQVLVHQDRTAGQRGPPADPFNLQAQVLNTHRVVAVDRTLVLQREDQVQVSAAAAHKGTAPLRSRHLKASIEFAPVVLAQEAIGRLQSADAPSPRVAGSSLASVPSWPRRFSRMLRRFPASVRTGMWRCSLLRRPRVGTLRNPPSFSRKRVLRLRTTTITIATSRNTCCPNGKARKATPPISLSKVQTA